MMSGLIRFVAVFVFDDELGAPLLADLAA